MYYNLSASNINHEPAEAQDCIKGELELRGKVGKNIEERTDKKGIPYCQFSAFSAEKVHDGFEYVWARFFLFDGKREAWLQPGARIQVKGTLGLYVFNDRLDFTCRVSEMKEYVPSQEGQPGQGQVVQGNHGVAEDKDEPPF